MSLGDEGRDDGDVLRLLYFVNEDSASDGAAADEIQVYETCWILPQSISVFEC